MAAAHGAAEVIRKQCQCGCGKWGPMRPACGGRPAQQFLNREHYLQSPQFHAQAVRGARACKAARDRHPARMALAGIGVLSARELLIYRKGHHNGYATGYDMGRRKGFADALREAPEIQWRKRRAA